MLQRVNWSEKLGQLWGGHFGRVLKVTLIFACAVVLLGVLYRVRTTRIVNEESKQNQLLQSVVANQGIQSGRGDKWVVLGNPEDDTLFQFMTSHKFHSPSAKTFYDYICSAIVVTEVAGWKTILIGPSIQCCKKPACYSLDSSQLLRLSFRSASVIRHLLTQGLRLHSQIEPYRDSLRNLAFLWAIQRGARFIFDAYIEEYQSAGVPVHIFEEELSRQLQTLALDESLALVEERGRSRVLSPKANPYTHFGRPDVRLLPGGAESIPKFQQTLSKSTHQRNHDYPSYRICEVRPPSIEKFLEIDDGWWDFRAPALVLPGDTMPPLCTRNTLFAPEVFWALPLLPDYSAINERYLSPKNVTSRIPPWYIRGLWSQSLLGDLGGSIRLSLSRVPTLTTSIPQDPYDTIGLYQKSNLGPSNVTAQARLLKRWNCRSKSTFRCLLLMSKELNRSVYLDPDDLSLIEAWVVDLKSIAYSEPRMLPKRRSQTNPCLGADGLHGVAFHPALEPKNLPDEFEIERNETLRKIVAKSHSEDDTTREKRETERPFVAMNIPLSLLPPNENATYTDADWSVHVSDYGLNPVDMDRAESQSTSTSSSLPEDSYLPHHDSSYEDYRKRDEYYSMGDEIGDRGIPLTNLDNPNRSTQRLQNPSPSATRTGRQFRAFLQQVVAKSVREGIVPDQFPILKAMAENMCPGYGGLLPHRPQNINSDILLIIAFTNHHYDLIPTLEVLYRSTFPNILYCGHPHESIEIFLRKYQTVEHRSFSFLPTYTRATYECVLGAIEMNYEVKGYLVITDETLLAPSSSLDTLPRDHIWTSSTGYDKVTRSNWDRIDPGGQKLPRLIEGIASSWRLFNYILQGQDFGDAKHHPVVQRRRRSEDTEELDTEETAYVRGSPFKWSHPASAEGIVNETTSTATSREGDLIVSDWEYAKASPTPTNSDDAEGQVDEEVLVGEEEDENNPPDLSMADILGGLKRIEAELNSTTSPPVVVAIHNLESGTENILPIDSVLIPTDSGPVSSEGQEDGKNVSWSHSNVFNGPGVNPDDNSSQTSSVSPGGDDGEAESPGVPLYHVEHLEPVNHKWRPESSSEKDSSTTTGAYSSTTSHPPSSTAPSYLRSTEAGKPFSAVEPGSAEVMHEEDLKREMDTLLESVHEAYTSLLSVINDYEESNRNENVEPPRLIHPSDFSSEVPENRYHPEDSVSHRISPREFRHIRCTRVDDGHQSELCSTLRSWVRTLGYNVGRDLRLFHDSIPVYYIPSQETRTLYSIANVLLHYGVMDELALPLLFRGLSPEEEWIKVNRTQMTQDLGVEFNDLLRPNPKAQYLYPLNLHRVYGERQLRHDFCSKYLLNILRS